MKDKKVDTGIVEDQMLDLIDVVGNIIIDDKEAVEKYLSRSKTKKKSLIRRIFNI